MLDGMKPVLRLGVEEGGVRGGKGAGVVRLRWNGQDGSQLAAVDANGRAHVWQLSEQLSSAQPGERAMLDQIGGIGR